MPSLNDSVLHAVFCACYFGTVGGCLVPAWYAFFIVFAVYVLLRYCTTWGLSPWNLLVYTCDVAFVVASTVLSASIVVKYSADPAILRAPYSSSALLVLAAALVWIPLVGRRALFVVSKIWIVIVLTVVAASFAVFFSGHPAFLVMMALVGVLFVCSLVAIFLGIVSDGVTCSMVPVSRCVLPLGGVFFCGALLIFSIVLQLTGPT